MSGQSESVAQFIENNVLVDKNSEDIQAFLDYENHFGFERDNETVIEWFCLHYDLGSWFIETMIANDISIIDLLIDIKARRQQEEKESSDYRNEVNRDLRIAQGGIA